MHFQRELVQDIFVEAMPLLKQHFAEISANPDIPLDPDFYQYERLETHGMLRAFTARDEGKKLIGYAIFFVRSNLHYKSSKQAVQDILYIEPGRRGTGGRFIKWCDEELRAEGCQVVYQHIKAAHNFGPLLERIGYKLVDLIYSRRLD